ncbi:hypothetical protein CSA17_06360 [bacterium DOLJORAL78_65_58]|nr:MAG: hypothetical protein CSB20_06120 [bacterium DOLZORAL124_64_63]PIE75656.1 MAG: hypothetical protein CSA17_06360 [bacterium DOLJORAL78_65_58]
MTRLLWSLFLLLLGLPGLCGSLAPPPPVGAPGNATPISMQPAPMRPAPMQPAPPETLRAEIVLPGGLPTCVGIEAPADSVAFGDPLALIFWFDDATVAPPAQPATTEAAWLHLGGWSPGEKPGSLILRARPYALDFFQVRAGEALGPILAMSGSGADLSEPAPVTVPHLWQTRWWLLLAATVFLAAVVWVLVKLWRRRRRLEPLQPWECAPPAWLQAAPRLRHLLTDDPQAAADTHLFCDRLAGQIRRFLAGRYLVPATEMTASEIPSGLQRRGYAHREAQGLIRLVKELDNHRYAPEAPSGDWVRQQAAAFFAGMAATRIMPRYTRVDPEILRAGEQAWDWLADPSHLAPISEAGTMGTTDTEGTE